MIRTFLKTSLVVVFALGFVWFAGAKPFAVPQFSFPNQSDVAEPLRTNTTDPSGVQTKTGSLVVDGGSAAGEDFEVSSGMMKVAGLASVGEAIINSDIKVGSSDLHPNASIQMYRFAHTETSKNICADDAGQLVLCAAVPQTSADGTIDVANVSMIRISSNVNASYCPSPVAYDIDWGDGTVETINPNTGTIQHNYATQGNYTITFGGTVCDAHIMSDHVTAIDFSGTTDLRQFELEGGGSGGSATQLANIVNSDFASDLRAIKVRDYPIGSFSVDQITNLAFLQITGPGANFSNTSLANMVGATSSSSSLTNMYFTRANLNLDQIEDIVEYYYTEVVTNGVNMSPKTIYMDDAFTGSGMAEVGPGTQGNNIITKAEDLVDNHGWTFNFRCDSSWESQSQPWTNTYDAC